MMHRSESDTNHLLECTQKAIVRWSKGESWKIQTDYIVREHIVRVAVNGVEYTSITCSPWNIKELVCGHLFCAGMLAKREELLSYNYHAVEQCAYVTVQQSDAFVFSGLDESTKLLSSDSLSSPNKSNDISISSDDIVFLMGSLEMMSDLFHCTGGVHSAALARNGEILAYFDDIGRHNAVDKIAGWTFLNAIDTRGTVLVFSGRMPYEIVSKVVRMGCSVLISPGAPTDISLRAADMNNLTVVGFTRDKSFNVYTCPDAIVGLEPELVEFSV